MQWRADIDVLRNAAAGLNGARVEAVHVPSGGPPGRASRFGLQLAFTREREDGTTRRRLRWLKVESVAWRLDGPDAVLAASGDDDRRLAADLVVLTGRKITAVHIQLPGWDTRFSFGEHLLTVFPVYHNEPSAGPDWTIRTARGRLLVVGPGPRWALAA